MKRKYKTLGALTIVAAILVSIIVPVYTADSNKRYHQHLEQPEKEPCLLSHEEGELCSHLPLICIDTGGVTIPGGKITETLEDGSKLSYYSTSEEGEEKIPAKIRVIDNVGYNHPEDAAELESAILIGVRGRTSRSFLKSSYSVKLINDDGSNNPQVMLGMDAHHEWVLNGPYLDKTYLRNYLFYNLSGEIMDYAPNVRYCEVILNGEYHGLYLLVEKITAGDNGARLQLEVNKKQNTFSGYLVQLNNNPENIINAPMNETADTFTAYTFRRFSDMEILYPGPSKLTEEMQRSITLDFSEFEKALYSFDYDDEELGYRKFIDVDSFVDAYLITEISCNYDFGALSTYVYKGLDGKFRMCPWDFNNSCDNFKDSVMDGMGYQAAQSVWYFMLMKDEDFTDRVIQRYWELRNTFFSDEYLDAYLSSTIEFLGPAIQRDRDRWADTYAIGHGLLGDEARDPKTFEEAVEQLHSFLHARLQWMNRSIDALSQYSAESKVKKFNHSAN